MKVSLNWIRYLNDKYSCAAEPAPGGIDKLVEKIGAQLGAVEEVVDVGKKYEGIVIVKVISNQKHPNADKLSVCLVDDGGAVKKVKRNKDGLVEIVHGATNVKAGMLAAWIPPGVTVPSTFDKEPFVIERRDIRGIASNGMLASPKELALSDDHEGILQVDEDVKPGTPFAQLYRLGDYVIDIENKMFTHRPDCFGVLGIAREVAGIQRHSFKSPNWYKEDAAAPTSNARNDHKLSVKNDVPKLVPRFCALVIKDVKVQPSPVFIQAMLTRVGIRPINNIVDITNFLMLETAQPLHAYDYDKVKTGILGVRLSKKGEELKLLGGKTVKLDEGAVVITDGKRPIGLGGVMGGADTEVGENTKTIILECANFDMSKTRDTAMKYGLFTDAAIRFTKNQSPRQNRAVIAKAADDILKLAGGRVSGKLTDDKHFDAKSVTVATARGFINSRLGLDLSLSEIKKLLENVEFKVGVSGEKIAVTAPFWRTDIEIAEDIVEEVGRLCGYDKLPQVLPERSLASAELNPMSAFKSKLRDILVRGGANEVLTYSFVNQNLLEAAGQDPKKTYHIRNALSPDLQYYRPSLAPSLLEKVHPNIKSGYGEFALFEIGKVHIKGMLDKEKLPMEFENLALVVTSKEPKAGAPYFAAKKYLEFLMAEAGIQDVRYSQAHSKSDAYEPNRWAWVNVGQTMVGVVGEPSVRLRQALKLPAYTAQFEVNITALSQVANAQTYQPLNRFPPLEQDFCLRSTSSLSYAELTEFMRSQLKRAAKEHGYNFDIRPLDIFQRPSDKNHKQTTWRITLLHSERTLTRQEVNRLLDKIAAEAKIKLSAERI